MQETWVRSLGWEVPLEKEMATHYSILAQKMPRGSSLVGYSPWDHKELDATSLFSFYLLFILSFFLSSFLFFHHSFSCKEQASFDFMAAIAIYSEFGTQGGKKKSVTVFTVSPSIFHKVMKLNAMILVFWMLSFKPTFSLACFTFIRGSSVLHFLTWVVSSVYLHLYLYLCICIYISSSNLDSSWCFIQSGILHHVFCKEVN